MALTRLLNAGPGGALTCGGLSTCADGSAEDRRAPGDENGAGGTTPEAVAQGLLSWAGGGGWGWGAGGFGANGSAASARSGWLRGAERGAAGAKGRYEGASSFVCPAGDVGLVVKNAVDSPPCEGNDGSVLYWGFGGFGASLSTSGRALTAARTAGAGAGAEALGLGSLASSSAQEMA